MEGRVNLTKGTGKYCLVGGITQGHTGIITSAAMKTRGVVPKSERENVDPAA